MNAPDLIGEAAAPTAWILPLADGRYEPATEGDDNAIAADMLPVEDRNGDVYDIAAWDNRNPRRWWLRTDHGCVLGADAIERSGRWETPVFLVGSPRAWIECQSLGLLQTACVLQWGARLWPLFSEAHEVRCASPTLTAHLTQTLRAQGPGFKINTIERLSRAA